jgi:hypothetical protein
MRQLTAQPSPEQQQQPRRGQQQASASPPVFLELISEHYENKNHFNLVFSAAGRELIAIFPDLKSRPYLASAVVVLAMLNPILRKKYGAVLMLKGGGALAYWVKGSRVRDFDFRLCAPGMETDKRLELVKNVFGFIRWFMRYRNIAITITEPAGTITPISVYKLKIQKEEAIDIIGMTGVDDDCAYVDVSLGGEAVISVIAYDELLAEWIRGYCFYAVNRQLLKIPANRYFIDKMERRLRVLFPELVDHHFTDDVIEYLSRRFPDVDRTCFELLRNAFKK